MRFDYFWAGAVFERMYEDVIGIIIIKDKEVVYARAGSDGKLASEIRVRLVGVVGKSLYHAV